MVKSSIRLLAIDIDGTLLDSSFQIPRANLEALRRAHEQGIEVVVVTGRRHSFAMPVVEMLGLDVWVISSNGAVTRSSRGELFHQDLLPLTTARRLCSAMADFRGNLVLTFPREDQGALVLERVDDMGPSIQRWLEKNQQYILRVSPIEDALTSDLIQAMFCGSIPRMQQAECALAERGFAGQVTVLKTQYPARDLSIVDVLNYGCSKGHALARWAQHRGFSREQVAAIGDNYNDVEMLEFAGTAFIMGNACDDLKLNGWRLAPSNDEAGVAAALEQLLG